jgi:hypothetical protein
MPRAAAVTGPHRNCTNGVLAVSAENVTTGRPMDNKLEPALVVAVTCAYSGLSWNSSLRSQRWRYRTGAYARARTHHAT